MDPTAWIFDQEEMRLHFFKCIMGSRVLTPFPIPKQWRASPKPKKVEAFSIYCHCRLPHKPEEPMIQCSHCKEWYHDTCEKVEEECWNSRSKPSGFAVFVVKCPCTLTLCTRALSIFIYQVKPHCRYSYCFVLSLPRFHQHCFIVCTVPVHSRNKDNHLHSTPISFLFIL